MKIGIVTWYWGNYGSELQAYALQRALEKEGCDALIIQHDLSDSALPRAVAKCKFIGIKSTFMLYWRQLIGQIVQKKEQNKIGERAQALSEFINTDLKLTKVCYNSTDYGTAAKEFDALVCGSDQVWNPVSTAYHDFYWLGFGEKGRKFSYAPSMGTKTLSPSEEKIIKGYLEDFAAVSVRERKSADMLNALQGVSEHVETVLDPTLLLDAEEWRSFAQSSQLGSEEDTNYLFAYMLRPTERQCKLISEYASARHLMIVTYPLLERMCTSGLIANWGDERVFSDGPREFLARIMNADCVVTDSFHCTLFSILFEKEFFVFKKASSDNTQFERIQNLLSVFNYDNRVVSSTLFDVPAYTSRDNSSQHGLVSASSRHYLRNAINRCTSIVD